MLTNENYFSQEASRIYTGATEIKKFMSCQEAALAEWNGEWAEDKKEVFMQGNYFDSFFDGTREQFEELNRKIIFNAKGAYYAPFQKVFDAYERVKRDKMWMQFAAEGQQELIMTGEIEGVPVKIKIDSYHDGKVIVDRKLMGDMKRKWIDGQWKSFIGAYGYDLSGWVYQEIVRQNTGKIIPVMLTVVTKEKTSQIEIININQSEMDSQEENVRNVIRQIQMLKVGEVEPNKCGMCSYCLETKVCSEILDSSALLMD